MKAVMLVENTALFATRLLAEHGFSLYIEDDEQKILYDTGCTDTVVKNAVKLGIKLEDLHYIIISHNHEDHSGGLRHIIKYYQDNAVMRKPTLIMSGMGIFNRRKFLVPPHTEIGFKMDLDVLERYFNVVFEPGVKQLTKNLVYLGCPERLNDFEGRVPQVAKVLVDGEFQDDYVMEDAQLAYLHNNGKDVSVISGCSHSGVCNIIEYAKKVTGRESVDTFIGGLHLQAPPEEVIAKTVEYIKNSGLRQFYACHDTDMPSLLRLMQVSQWKQAGVAITIQLD